MMMAKVRLTALIGILLFGIEPRLVTPQTNSTAAPTVSKWGGCVDPAGGSTEVKIGDTTIVCLQVGNGTQWNQGVSYIRLSFKPQADEYSRFHIPNSFNDLIANNSGSIWDGGNITVGAASLDQLSFLRVYHDRTNGRVFPFLTAIINVNKGIVTGITWDDACIFCRKSQCVEDTYDFNGVQQTQASSGQPTKGCYIKESECGRLLIEEKEKSTACDLTLYVVWTGTDARGGSFQSSAYRFSAFPAQEIENRISQNIPDWVNNVPVPFGNA